jgi:hypothetical protein
MIGLQTEIDRCKVRWSLDDAPVGSTHPIEFRR